jgi:hypothetical protein
LLRPPSSRLLLLLVLAALGLAACRRPDSILLVEVAGIQEIHPTQFRVTVTTGLESRVLVVPPDAGAPMTLPISFSVELDRSRTAPVTVAIEAFDDLQSIIGCGTTVQRHIQIGGQTVMTVWMDPSCGGQTGDGGVPDGGGPGADAGAGDDGATDAGDDAPDDGGGAGLDAGAD